MNAIGRNDPCPCGSGKKYKKCCLARDEALARQRGPAGPNSARADGHWTAISHPKVDEAVDELLARVDKGQLHDVEARLEALLREYPDYHMTNYAMGVYRAMILEQPESAIPLFENAIRTFPPLAEAHYSLGTCYVKAARIREARTAFDNAIRYSGDDDYVGAKARDQLRTLEEILTKDSPFKTLDEFLENQKLFELAFEHLTAQRYQEAIGLFDQVLAQNPKHVQSHGNLALAYAGLGQKARALEHLEKALALDRTYAPAIQNRAALRTMKEGEPFRPEHLAQTEYYRERAEAEHSGSARRRWRGW